MSLKKSEKLFKQSQKSLAGGVSSHFRAISKPAPMFFEQAKGSKIRDADGNEYIDYTLAQGPMILGHSPAPVLRAVKKELDRGQLFAGQHTGEIELADLFKKHVPCAELTRFSLTGSEAVQTALRLARGYTGRTKYIKFEGHYHGWYDNVLISVIPSEEERGPREKPIAVGMTYGQTSSVLDEVSVLPWNDLKLLRSTVRKYEKDIAAIIMEPIMCNSGCIMPREGFLEGVRNLCNQKNIPLIFDEIITGFRCAIGGAQSYLKVTPDIATFGKAMAGGFPISAITGKRYLMDMIASGEVMHAGTFNTYNIGVTASVETIKLLGQNRGEGYRHIHKVGKKLMTGIRAIARKQKKPLLVQGPGPMFHVGFTENESVNEYRECGAYDAARYGALVQGLRERGIRLIGRGIWYISAAHSERDAEKTLKAFENALSEV